MAAKDIAVAGKVAIKCCEDAGASAMLGATKGVVSAAYNLSTQTGE